MDKALQDKLKDHAWRYGHFRNPEYPDTHNVMKKDLALLSIGDEHLRQAIASVQTSDVHCDLFCHVHHGRKLAVDDDGKADGDPAKATIALLDVRRCLVSDFATEADEFGLAGRGAWSDCDDEREHHHEVVIKFDDRQAPDKWVGYMGKVLANAVKISADMGLSVRYISPSVTDDYQSSVLFRNIPGGVIGYYYLPQGSGCRRIPQGALDTSYQPDVQMASLLWIHEGLGHGAGLQHRPGGIMNPSIRRTTISWRGDPSEGDMRRLYGGVALDDPTDRPDDDVVTSVITFNGKKHNMVEKGSTGGGGSFGDW